MTETFRKLFLFLFFCISIFLIIFIYSKGILFYDEGWVLHPAQRILQGEVPYRDFHYIYTPGSAYTTALSFLLFGQSILSTRILLFIITALTILVILHITKLLKFGLISTILSIGIFIAWLPLQINFSWPVVYVALTYFLTILTVILFRKNKDYQYLILTGLMCFLAFFLKQNFGVALILSSVTYLLIFDKQKFKSIIYYATGLLGSLAIWLAYLLSTNSFVPFLKDMYTFFIIGKGILTTPFIYPAPILTEISKSFFYLLPLIFSVFAIYLVRRKNINLLIISIFSAFFYLFGIRPTTDYTHYVPLLAISGLTIGAVLETISGKFSKSVILIFALILIVLGIYTAFFRNYYTWNPTILNYNQSINSSRVGVFIDGNSKANIIYLQNYINANTKEGDYIFVTRFSPLWYFLLNRKNPTKYEFLQPYLDMDTVDREIITNLKQTNTKIIISDYPVETDIHPISEYIKNNYVKISVNDWPIWIKK